MRFSGLFLLIMFIFTNSVTSNEDDINKELGKERTVQARYHFNHPPSVEYYNPIPVAVVYENESGYSGRSDGITTQTFDTNLKIEVNSEEIVKRTTEIEDLISEREDITTEREETTTIIAAIARTKKVELIPKPRALNNFQIPVAVVYETDSKSSQNYFRTKTGTNTETTRKHPNYRQSKKIIANVDVPKEQSTTTLKGETEASPTSIETGTFRKRTGGREPVVPILESENYVFSHNGMFHYRYESGDGTIAHSEGRSKTIDDETGEAVVGGFSYTDNEGNDFSLSYTADENGYRPVGAHLPTPPPIPPAIARALAYLATATPEPVTKRPKSESFVR